MKQFVFWRKPSVSTVNHNQDPELQLAEMRRYVASRGWILVQEYVDHEVSGLSRKTCDKCGREFLIVNDVPMTAEEYKRIDPPCWPWAAERPRG